MPTCQGGAQAVCAAADGAENSAAERKPRPKSRDIHFMSSSLLITVLRGGRRRTIGDSSGIASAFGALMTVFGKEELTFNVRESRHSSFARFSSFSSTTKEVRLCHPGLAGATSIVYQHNAVTSRAATKIHDLAKRFNKNIKSIRSWRCTGKWDRGSGSSGWPSSFSSLQPALQRPRVLPSRHHAAEVEKLALRDLRAFSMMRSPTLSLSDIIDTDETALQQAEENGVREP